MPLPSSPSLESLRATVSAIASCGAEAIACLPFGIPAMDQRLPGGGLTTTALHEVSGASSTLGDDAAATLFAAGIAARRGQAGGSILWAFTRRDLFAPALHQAGLPPHRIIYAECSRDEEVLAIMEEGLRHCGLAAVVGEIGRVTMTATRRLQLAAENSGMTALMLRRWRRNGEDPLSPPSAAVTRWRIGCVPSQPLPVRGIARPRWRIELVRQRGGPPHEWIMEGTDEAGRLTLPTKPFHRPAPADRSDALGCHAA